MKHNQCMARANTLLNPLNGENEWLVRDDEYDYHQEVANAGFGDMLHDNERNEKYYEALRQTIIQMHLKGEVVNVLDIGTGTGILSMMAVKAGADSVTACEAFLPMAYCAERIINKNGMKDKINLIKKRSTDLKIGEDLPQRANLLVTEILDTELIGEGAISIYNHAHAHLLTEDAICIPNKARCHVQVVQSSLASMWNILKILPSTNGEILLEPPKEIVECKGEASLHDVQLSQVPLEKFNPITDQIEIFQFDFMNQKVLDTRRRKNISIRAQSPGTADLVFFWWSIDLDPSASITLSCAPFWCHPDLSKLMCLRSPTRPLQNIVPWRDHWLQAIYHIPKPILLKSKGSEFVLSCNHDEFSFWFDIFLPRDGPSKSIPRHTCSCSFHNTFSRNRIGMMNTALRNKVYLRYLEKSLNNNSKVLVLGDGCILGLSASKLGAKSVVIHEPQRLVRKFMQALAKHNNIENVEFVEHLENLSDDIVRNFTHIFAEPYFVNSIFPWDNLYYGTLINKLKPKLSSLVQISPWAARIYVCPVEFIDLHKIRQPVGNCQGFDLSLFDEMVDNSRALAHARIETHALWEYPCFALGYPYEMLSIAFDKYELDQTHEYYLRIEKNGKMNAIVIWTDFSTDGRYSPSATVSTGPIEEIIPGCLIKWNMFTRQGVHFFKTPSEVVSQDNRVLCTSEFKPTNGQLSFRFEVLP